MREVYVPCMLCARERCARARKEIFRDHPFDVYYQKILRFNINKKAFFLLYPQSPNSLAGCGEENFYMASKETKL